MLLSLTNLAVTQQRDTCHFDARGSSALAACTRPRTAAQRSGRRMCVGMEAPAAQRLTAQAVCEKPLLLWIHATKPRSLGGQVEECAGGIQRGVGRPRVDLRKHRLLSASRMQGDTSLTQAGDNAWSC